MVGYRHGSIRTQHYKLDETSSCKSQRRSSQSNAVPHKLKDLDDVMIRCTTVLAWVGVRTVFTRLLLRAGHPLMPSRTVKLVSVEAAAVPLRARLDYDQGSQVSDPSKGTS